MEVKYFEGHNSIWVFIHYKNGDLKITHYRLAVLVSRSRIKKRRNQKIPWGEKG